MHIKLQNILLKLLFLFVCLLKHAVLQEHKLSTAHGILWSYTDFWKETERHVELYLSRTLYKLFLLSFVS
jgi:hypothetical protein